jgi:probable F420-dependent oxidoreductase
MTRPFRFIAPMPNIELGPSRWRDAVRALEAGGFSAVAISDHVSRGWAMDPLVAMMAAADATTTLRVLSMVLANDYRHPALVHRAIASIDVFSGGRAELGLGAGWLSDDYAALGLGMDPPGTRIARLEEAVRLIKLLFEAEAPVSFAGDHYRAASLEALPRTVQRPRPPILVGGGGRRVLELAGREADVVGVNASLARGSGRRDSVAGLGADLVDKKVAWVRGAAPVGRGAVEAELQVSVLHGHLAASSSEASAVLDRLAGELDLDRAIIEASPTVLIGTVERCVELLLERRVRWGFSAIKLGPDPLAMVPIVERLAGT